MSYYPTDHKLQHKIVQKLEFNDLYNPEGLYRHQEFVRRYLSPYTPYKGLLVFHSLGSGKSLICISVAVDHYLYDGKKCLIVTKGSSGRENFKKEIEHYYEMGKFSADKYPDKGIKITPREYAKIFVMNHYMALHNSICAMTDRDIMAQFSNMIFVFDEIHNIRQLKIIGDDSSKSHVYDSLKRIIKLANNTKIMLATATPMTNDIGQLNSTISLLTDDDSYHGIISYNTEIKDKPTKIFHGVDGYLTDTKVYLSQMIGHQRQHHIMEQRKGTPKDIYRMLTHVSLFAFPESGMYGRTIYDKHILEPTKYSKEIIPVKSRIKKTVTYTMYKIVDKYRKYLTGDGLRECSSKYWELMDILENKHPNVGPIFVFVEEVRGSGLLLLANIFEAHGYELYVGQNLQSIGKGKRFTICVGDQSVVPNQLDRLDGFNHKRNINGEYVRVLIGSKVVGESITLRNVRMFHVMTIHWNDSTIEQAVGRVVRSGSHSDLAEHERKVDIFIHAAICDNVDSGKMGGEGTDVYKLAICSNKQRMIYKMENKLRKHAVDRYIIQKEPSSKYVPCSDPSTFIRYYMERYATTMIPKLETIMRHLFAKYTSIPITSVLKRVDHGYRKVMMELICRVVTNNIHVMDNMYLREDVGELFLTDDPSMPFFFIRDRNVDGVDVTFNPKYNIPAYHGKARMTDTVECMDMLRRMSFIQRISLVEKYVQTTKVPPMMSALFTKYRNKLYHIMCYRAPGEAYTAVLPIPKQNILQCRMRVLGHDGWEYVEDADKESRIVERMEDEYAYMMSNLDSHEDVFLVISLIDGKSRIRTRFLETTNKGLTDKRYVRKGRSLASILKPTLVMLYAYICNKFGKKGVDVSDICDKYYDMSNEYILPYGYKSMKKFARDNSSTFAIFVYAMEYNTVTQTVQAVERLMIENKKCVFL